VVDIIFLICAIFAVIFSVLVVLMKNPIYSSLFLVGSFLPIATIYILMYAPFVAVIQILVYAGAILVLFTFVIMMIDLKEKEFKIDKSNIYRFLAFGVVSIFLIIMLSYVGFKTFPDNKIQVSHAKISDYLDKKGKTFGSTKAVGELIFGKPDKNPIEANKKTMSSMQIVSFELASILIIVALVGALVLGKSRREKIK